MTKKKKMHPLLRQATSVKRPRTTTRGTNEEKETPTSTLKLLLSFRDEPSMPVPSGVKRLHVSAYMDFLQEYDHVDHAHEFFMHMINNSRCQRDGSPFDPVPFAFRSKDGKRSYPVKESTFHVLSCGGDSPVVYCIRKWKSTVWDSNGPRDRDLSDPVEEYTVSVTAIHMEASRETGALYVYPLVVNFKSSFAEINHVPYEEHASKLMCRHLLSGVSATYAPMYNYVRASGLRIRCDCPDQTGVAFATTRSHPHRLVLCCAPTEDVRQQQVHIYFDMSVCDGAI